jgi:hypothetical protein
MEIIYECISIRNLGGLGRFGLGLTSEDESIESAEIRKIPQQYSSQIGM